MTISTVEIIEHLDSEAIIYDELGESGSYEEGIQLQITANTLRRFRDTLISIANCRNGVASHQAQAALIETGECAHFNSTYTLDAMDESKTGWHCNDCGKESAERPGAFE